MKDGKSKRGAISTHCVSTLDIYHDVSLFLQTLLNNLMDVERVHSMIMTGSELYRNVNILTRILDLRVLHCCSSNESFLSFCHKAEDALPLAILYICMEMKEAHLMLVEEESSLHRG